MEEVDPTPPDRPITPFRHSNLLAIAALLGMPSLLARERKQPEEKPCLNCGKPKVHNNSFCSAECCKTYKHNNK